MRQNQINAFEAWISEGNAAIIDNAWSTQDAAWTNRIETKGQLWAYYLREFFDINHAQYFFTEVLKYMDVKSEREYVLKYDYASQWIVDLFMTTRAAEFGRFANYEGLEFSARGMKFRIDKQFGRFGRYGKLYMTLEDGVELDDFLYGVSSKTPNC
jgi:hypothetical protein